MANEEIDLGWGVLDQLPRGEDGEQMAAAIRSRIVEVIAGERKACSKLVANFLRQIAETDWSKKELSELAKAVDSGERQVTFNPDY